MPRQLVRARVQFCEGELSVFTGYRRMPGGARYLRFKQERKWQFSKTIHPRAAKLRLR